MAPLRIGTLGAARITAMALLRPAREVPEIEVTAIAARDPERARRFATRHGIPRTHASYQELIDDPEIDAIYNPLPNGLHCEWTVRALEAGKHVLCEKPIASNADEARQMAAAAARSNRILTEAFHWRYHPLANRMREVIESGTLGEVQHIEAALCFPMLAPGNIRYRYDLAGGATMDAGCYTVNIVRFLAAAEPEVVSARALLASPRVDRAMRAELRFADGRRGAITCSLLSSRLLAMSARVAGTRGELRVFNPLAPHIYHRLTLRGEDGTRRERVPGDATYTHQLRAFARAVESGQPMSSDGEDGVRNMVVIDAVYERSGLGRRGI